MVRNLETVEEVNTCCRGWIDHSSGSFSSLVTEVYVDVVLECKIGMSLDWNNDLQS